MAEKATSESLLSSSEDDEDDDYSEDDGDDLSLYSKKELIEMVRNLRRKIQKEQKKCDHYPGACMLGC